MAVYTKSLLYKLSAMSWQYKDKWKCCELNNKIAGLHSFVSFHGMYDHRGEKPFHILIGAGMFHPNRKGSLRAEKSMVKELRRRRTVVAICCRLPLESVSVFPEGYT